MTSGYSPQGEPYHGPTSGVPIIPAGGHYGGSAHGYPVSSAPYGQAPSPGPAHPPYYYPASPPPRRRGGLLALAIVGVACILVGGGIFAMLYFSNVGPFKDSGLAMCESIRDGQDAGSASDSDSPLTEAEYLELRAQFANSRYADIRDAGTRFVDLVWQLSSVDDDDSLGAALLFAGQIMEAYSALSGACAAHGVVIPPLSAN